MVIGYGGLHLRALQLDMLWPGPKLLAELNVEHSGLRIILAIGEQAIAQAGDDPERVLDRLCEYSGCVNDVLIDTRMADGKTRSVTFLKPLIESMYEQLPDLGLCVSGGLGPETLKLVGQLPVRYAKFSIQGERNCRKKADMSDKNQMENADRFLREAVRLLQGMVPKDRPA